MAATLAVRTAGCVFAVSVSSVSGPSPHRRESEKPSASSASCQTAAALLNACARATPIPTACEPCPGKRKATFTWSSRGAQTAPSEPPPKRTASRRTTRGWGPAVRGEQSESCAGEAGARTRPSRSLPASSPASRRAPCAARRTLPPQERGAPREAPAERREQHQVAGAQPPRRPRLFEGHVHRRRARVAVAVDVDEDPVHRHAQA